MTKGRRVCLRRRRSGERGQALVEMVILLPLFLLLVFGMIEFGRVFNYWIDMTHLASEGSRYAMVNRWPGCTTQSENDPGASCTYATLQDYLVPRGNTGEIRAELAEDDGVQICYPENSLLPGEPVRVIVNAEIRLPVLNSLLGLLGVDEVLDMRATSTERLEWTPDRLNEMGYNPGEGMLASCP